MEDATNLLVALEFAFDVELPTDQAEQLKTTGQLADELCAHLRARGTPETPLEKSASDIFAFIFERVRSIFVAAGAAESSVTRVSRLDKVLPRATKERHRVWQQLDLGDYHLFPLEAPEFTATTLGILLYSFPFGVLIGIIQISSAQNWNEHLTLWVPLLVFASLLLIMPRLIRRIHLSARRPPLATVGDLVDFLVIYNYWQLATERGSWSEDEVWRVLQTIIARETGVEAERISRDLSLKLLP